jgi:hypothetical protein
MRKLLFALSCLVLLPVRHMRRDRSSALAEMPRAPFGAGMRPTEILLARFVKLNVQMAF